jgi:hypothetical protein
LYHIKICCCIASLSVMYSTVMLFFSMLIDVMLRVVLSVGMLSTVYTESQDAVMPVC